MKRLTEKDGQGNWGLKGVSWENLREGQVITREVNERLYGALCKLRDYEDTGCSPDDMEQVNNFEQGQAGKLLKRLNEEERKYRWIPVEERTPEDGDSRFYMCIMENHEEDLPMFCQYDEGLGFGFWTDIYDKETLGFIDSEFATNEELGYEKVIAWRPLPEPYQPEED